MKKTVIRIVSLVLCSFFALLLSSCYSQKEYDYYTKLDSYIMVTGTVSHIKYLEDPNALYLAFDDMSTELSDNNFKIVGDNLSVVLDNGIEDMIEIGQSVSFITAPRYFGDGYVMPIVAIEIEGTELLSFQEGYQNLLKWIKSNGYV